MSEWTLVKFGSIVAKLVNGGTPPTEVAKYWSGNTPWVTGADFTPSGLGEFRRFVSDEAVRETSTNVIAQNQLLLVTRTGVGKLAIAPCDVAISQDITGVYPNASLVDSLFLYHRMKVGVEELKKLNQGTSINGIVRGDLTAYPIKLPALPQQRRIAEILATVDDAIEATEALIAKQQQIKAGLMHDLFTRGVWTAESIARAKEDGSLAAAGKLGLSAEALAKPGQLRPSREAAPELYKESPLGWIPRDWEVKFCSEVSKRICVGIVIQPTQYYQESGVPAFRSANVRENGLTLDDLVFISPEANAILTKSQVKGGDIVTVRTGYPGTSAVVPDEWSGHNCIDILITTPNEHVLSWYLSAWINSPFGKNQVLSKQGGLAQQHFNVGALRELKVGLPGIEEQDEIVKRFEAVNSEITKNEIYRHKLMLQKQGLMQDLLSGRVEVKL
jgi:type I restriction enzyme S subunit